MCRTNSEQPHYDRRTLLDTFEAMLPFFSSVMDGHKDANASSTVSKFARIYFEMIMFKIPFIGDLQRHPLGQTLIESGVSLSFYASIRKFGRTKEQAATIIVDAARARLKSASGEDNRKNG